MSFVRSIFNKMSTGDDKDADMEEYDDASEETSTESSDTGIFTAVNSDLESSGHVDADCSAISNFFGYWKNLINQEAKFQSQLNDLSKQLSVRDSEATKLRFQMEELQRDVFAKSAGVDRLQTELNAAQKESEIARQRLQHLEHDLTSFRQKNRDLEEELGKKTADNYEKYESQAQAKITELENYIHELQGKISLLEGELKIMKEEKQRLEREHAELIIQRVNEKKLLDEAKEELEVMNKKWEKDFEKLRTINIMKEQQLLDDFEWKLREVEQKCKKKLQDTDQKTEQRLQEAYKDIEEKIKESEKKLKEVEYLKAYELEAKQLRGLTVDQETTIKTMINQQEQMKQAEDNLKNETKRLRNLIDMEKENLQHIQRLHRQDIADKERKLQQILDQKRTEIAMYWEERLLHECRRLKVELEQLHYEEKCAAIAMIKKEKDCEILETKASWDKKVQDCLKEIASLKKSLSDKDGYYQHEMALKQTKTDRDVLQLRRLMDKIDMSHHEKFEKMVRAHDEELEKINEETEQRIKDIETSWQNQVSSMRTTLELVKEQMERESQNKIQNLLEQHRAELDTQWENLLHQKTEAVKLVEEEYVSKYKTLEEQFYTQQKSHSSREVELLKTIDSLKNDLSSRDLTIDDLQNNVDTLEGGVQVLHQEIAHQGEQLLRTRRDADHKIRGLQESLANMQEQQEQEKEQFRLQMAKLQKQSQTTIEQLQRKCQCLTKLFEEVRARYERRESRQEDINMISDLRQIIAEQEKDLACMNEEKRYFQMKLMSLEKGAHPEEESPEVFSDCHQEPDFTEKRNGEELHNAQSYPNFLPQINGPLSSFSIPPTIPECDDCDE